MIKMKAICNKASDIKIETELYFVMEQNERFKREIDKYNKVCAKFGGASRLSRTLDRKNKSIEFW